MATVQEIDAEIAKRQRIADIDALIAQKQGGITDAIIEPLGSIGAGLAGFVGSGLSGIAELIRTGDLDSAANAVRAVQQGVSEQFAPETEAGRRGLETVGGAIQSIDENIIRPAVAGTAGLAQLALRPTDLEGAKQTVRSVREQGLGPSAGQQAFDVTGSPAIATAFETAPVLLEEAAGGLLGRAIGATKVAKAEARTDTAQKAIDAIESGEVTDAGLQDIADTIQRGTPKEIADIVQADPKFFAAADELGISTEPLAAFTSKNPQFRDVSGALQKVPGSVLDVQARTFINETSQIADNLITQYGGTLDKAQLGLDFKADSLRTVDNLFEQADEAYSSLKQVLPQESRFNPAATVSFLEQLQRQDKLSPKLSRMLSQLKPKTKTTKGKVTVNPATGARTSTGTTETINPTLGRIDIVRKEIGQAIGKGSGQFKDVETGLNKALYARLSRDMDDIATSSGGDALALSDTAKGLVRQRKQIEDNLVTLLGKDLNQALNVNVAGVVKNLQKGEVDKFNKVIRAIPKQKRGEVVLSAMNDVFKGTGVNQQQLSPTSFTKWYQTIKRSPAASKALFDALPPESKKAVDNLFEVSRGISRALGQTTPTGRINAMFNNETGFIRKMVGRTVPTVVAFATGSPTASVMASGAVEQFLKQTTDSSRKASDLMSTSQFQNVIRQSVKDGVVDGNKASQKLLDAESKLMKSKRYQEWVNTLTDNDRAALQGGLLGYLFSQEQEQK